MGTAPDYSQIYDDAGQEWGVDPNILKAIGGQETGGLANPNQAVSPKGAQGVMQVMPATGAQMGMTDPTDPVQSIFTGAKYYRSLLDKYGDPVKATAAYNAGPGRVDDVLAGKATLPDETVAYVPGVISRYQKLAAAQNQGGVFDDATASTPQQPITQGSPTQATLSPLQQLLKAGDSTGQSAANSNTAKSNKALSPLQQLLAQGDDAATSKMTPPATPAQPAPGGGLIVAANDPRLQATDGSTAYKNPDGTFTLLAPSTAASVSQNVGAGLVEGAQNTANVLSDPIGNMVGRPLATGLIAAHDALASRLGYQPFDATTRNMLLGDQVPQAGTRVVNALGGAVNMLPGSGVADPAAVVPGNPLEQAVRQGTAGGVGGMLAGPAMIVPGAIGSVAGGLVNSSQAVPDYLKPVASLAANALAAGGTVGAAKGLARVGGADGTVGTQNALAPPVAAENRLTGNRVEPVVAQNDAAAGPQSAGAAASRDNTPGAQIDMTPAQMQANRTRAEMDKLTEPQPTGRDNNAYVPGVNPTSADIEQSVATSREQKALGQKYTEVSQEQKTLAANNNLARQDFYRQQAGSPVETQNAIDDASAQAKVDLANTFGGKTAPVDSAALYQQLTDQLNTPRNAQNDQLKAVLQPQLNKLVNDDGSAAITNPEELYGWRENLGNLISKETLQKNPDYAHVKGQVAQAMDAADQHIQDAAPGYQDYLDNYSSAMRPIEAQQVLQKIEPSLYDTSGNNMQLSRVQGALKGIVQARAGRGNNPYKSISDDQMSNLFALRDDLRRSASADQLAAAKGSDTSQNAMDAVKYAGNIVGNVALHGAANYVAPGVGSFAIESGKRILGGVRQDRLNKQNVSRGLNMLQVDPASLRNPLAGP